jgi:hypothetical protein
VALALQAQHHEAERLQAVERARRGGGQHHVGPECHDGLDLCVVQPAELGQLAHLGRPVGVAVHADQARAAAQRADRLGQRGQQADDALRRRLEQVLAAGVVAQGERLRTEQPEVEQQEQDRLHFTLSS